MADEERDETGLRLSVEKATRAAAGRADCGVQSLEGGKGMSC